MNGDGFHLTWVAWDHRSWRTDLDVRCMPLATRMIYFELLNLQADEGRVPSDPVRAARAIGEERAEVEAVWAEVSSKFVTLDDAPGYMHNPRMTRAREECLARHHAHVAAGARGGLIKAENARRRASSEARSDASSGASSEALLKTKTIDLLPTVVSPAPQAEPTKVGGDVTARMPETLPLFAEVDLDVPANGAAKREVLSSRRREPSHDDLDAYEVLAAAWPLVRRYVPDYPETEKAWRQRNKAAALTLSQSLRTDADPKGITTITYALTFAYTHPEASRFYGTMTSLAKLQEAIPKMRAMRTGTSGPKPAKSMTGPTGLRAV